MENVDPASLLNKVKEGQHREGIHTGFLSLEHLPREVLIRVVSKLANDVSALKSLCVTSRSLADVFRSAIAVQRTLSRFGFYLENCQLFRDNQLWSLLIFERWGVTPVFGCERRERSLSKLQKDFAKSILVDSLSQEVSLHLTDNARVGWLIAPFEMVGVQLFGH